MPESERLLQAPRPHGAAHDFAILDGGRTAIEPAAYAGAIRSILDGELAELARDRNSICYRVRLAGGAGIPAAAIVKVPRWGAQRTNADATFAGEAAILARLPAAGIDNAPWLLARIRVAGIHYLFTTELPGKHPDARRHPLDGPQLHAILAGLYVMDRQGFMHYDLKAANILVTADRAAFIDFEFSRFGDRGHELSPAPRAWCEDFNVSGNPHFPARSNVANFEFRALHRYLVELADARSPAVAEALLRRYLRGRSRYHASMAGFLAGLAAASGARIAAADDGSEAGVAPRFDAAIAHERMLAELLAAPTAALVRVERAVMAFRCQVFEHREAEARALWRDTLAALEADAAGARASPDGYARAARQIFEFVARSVHPPA